MDPSWWVNEGIVCLLVCACVLSNLVMSDSLWAHGLWPARLFCPWDSPGKYTGVGCISFSRGSSWPKDQTQVSCIYYLGRQTLYHWATWSLSDEPAVYLLKYLPFLWGYLCVYEACVHVHLCESPLGNWNRLYLRSTSTWNQDSSQPFLSFFFFLIYF